MPGFTLEIIWQGKSSVLTRVLRLSDERTIWCQVEALALRIQNTSCAFIRVKNSEGETVVRTGVDTAVASIEKCPCLACPLKRKLEQRISAKRLTVA
jgi:hypothetical protein